MKKTQFSNHKNSLKFIKLPNRFQVVMALFWQPSVQKLGEELQTNVHEIFCERKVEIQEHNLFAWKTSSSSQLVKILKPQHRFFMDYTKGKPTQKKSKRNPEMKKISQEPMGSACRTL